MVREADPDELFGPLNASGAWFDAWTACGHTALVCGIAWIGCQPHSASDKSGLATWLLLLTACDIAWANGWLILTAPASSSTRRDRPRSVPGRGRPVRHFIAGHPGRGFLTSGGQHRRDRVLPRT